MNSAERFTGRVADYVKYRPGYPPELLDLFREEMDLRPTSVVADVGSGTGISARMFLAAGNRVFGVEPNRAMRAAAEDFLKDFPNFVSVDGTAEATTLPDESVDSAVAAQAFHWFDPAKTRAEFRRILRNKGYAALIWNERQLETNAFLRGYERLLQSFGSDYEKVRHDNIGEEFLRDFFQTDFRRKTFQNAQTLDFDGLRGRVLSSSFMPVAGDENFAPMIAALERLFAEHEEKGKIQILYSTNIFYAQI